MLYKTYDVIENWGCDFLFTKEEILEWRKEPFYCFILGQHTMQGRINNNYRADWQESNYFKRGHARAFRPEKKKVNTKKGPGFTNIKTTVERDINKYHESFVRYRGMVLPVMIPYTTRVRFKPLPGMNFTIDAKVGPYIYNLRERQFIFAWKKVVEDMPYDFTATLNGVGEWPTRFKSITLNFDVDWIQAKAVREYHFINFILSKKKRSWATYDDWFDFRAMIADRGTIY